MKSLHYLLASFLLFLMGPLHAVPLESNTITANGTYTITTYPGKKYTLAVGGSFGGASVAVNWRDASGNSGAVPGSPSTAAETYTFAAPTTLVDIIVTGYGGVPISITVSLADGNIDAVTLDNLSTTGGANMIPLLDANGNWTTGPFANAGTLWGNQGNIIFPDLQGFRWMDPSGALSENGMFMWETHGGAPELIVNAENRLALIYRSVLQLGPNDGLRYPLHAIFTTGGISDTSPLRESGALSFTTVVQPTSDPGSGVRHLMGFQAWPLDRAGTTRVLRLFDDAVMTGENGGPGLADTNIGKLTGAVCAEFHNLEGLYTPGTAPAFVSLTDGATITQTCSKYRTVQSAKVTLGGNRTLAFSSAESGMRGVIYVSQDGTGSRTLTLPTGSATPSGWALSTAAYAVDRLGWEYDGTYIYWTMAKGITLPVDGDAAAFIAAASITDDTQETAINNMVLALKGAGLWTKIYAAYPFVGGNQTAHSKDLKGTYNGTFGGGVTHDANGITGDATSAYFNTAFDFAAVSALNSASAYVYCRTQTPTDGRYFLGATGTSSMRVGIGRSGANMFGAGINANDLTTVVATSTEFRKHFAMNRSAAGAQELYVGSSAGANTVASSSACDRDIMLLARNNGGTADTFSNANLAFAMFGQSLTNAEWVTFRAIVDAFQTALARANP